MTNSMIWFYSIVVWGGVGYLLAPSVASWALFVVPETKGKELT